MKYIVDIYEIDVDNRNRFALGSLSEKTLFVFGLNPSTADDQNPDRTIKKIMGFAEKNRYTSFVMLNLYPKRSTRPNELPSMADEVDVERNIKIIKNLIFSQENVDILLA